MSDLNTIGEKRNLKPPEIYQRGSKNKTTCHNENKRIRDYFSDKPPYHAQDYYLLRITIYSVVILKMKKSDKMLRVR